MPRAQCLLPDGPNYRKPAFLQGLRAAGYEVDVRISSPAPDDILIIWNRSASRELEARRFELSGARVLVCENGYLGKEWHGRKWFALAWGHHAGAGAWLEGGSERWDGWQVNLAPWRDGAGETVILAQRGIGEPGVASPPNWAQAVQRRIGGRIRPHPGPAAGIPLMEDLAGAAAVVTFHSAAALNALILGVPVWYAFNRWIGARGARSLADFGKEPKRDDVDRLAMFRRLAWAMWSSDEIEDGTAFRHLRNCSIETAGFEKT